MKMKKKSLIFVVILLAVFGLFLAGEVKADRRVFVTSGTYTGDLVAEANSLGLGPFNDTQGLLAADAICQYSANNAGLSATYKVWLSDDSTGAADRLSHSGVPYYRVDGAIVADDWDDLTDCGNPDCLQNPINVDETGAELSFIGTWLVWSNTDTDGTRAPFNYHCFDWTSVFFTGYRGLCSEIDFEWTNYGSPNDCTNERRLYCFGESGEGPPPNNPPTITSVSDDSPQPGNSDITFTALGVDDPDGDPVDLYICSYDSCTNCGPGTDNSGCYGTPGGPFSPPYSNVEATYTCSFCEHSENNYWAKVCDDNDDCSDIIVALGSFSWTAPSAITNNTTNYADLSPSVSCPSSSYCLVTWGYSEVYVGSEIFYSEWDGSSWTAPSAITSSSDAADYSPSVSCPSSSYCLVTWGRLDMEANREIFYSEWDGSSWTAPSVMTSSSDGGSKPFVSCPSSSYCLVTWDYSEGGSDSEIFYSEWDGSSWTAPSAITINSYEDDNPSISCPSSSYCLATWYYREGGGDAEIFYSEWDGSSWTAPSAITSNSNQDYRPSVSCPSSSYCLVTWQYVFLGHAEIFYSEWDGSSWTVPLTIASHSDDDGSSSVSCPSSSYCQAIWEYDEGGADYEIFYSEWDGSSWTAPSAITSNSVFHDYSPSVSCPSSSYCLVTWQYREGGDDWEILYSEFTPHFTCQKEDDCDCGCPDGVCDECYGDYCCSGKCYTGACPPPPPPCEDHNVWGWTWSENIGWVSMSCENCDTDDPYTESPDGLSNGAAGCPAVGESIYDYGVDIDEVTGVLSGYAWSENIGWISFADFDGDGDIDTDDKDISGSPCAPNCEAKVETAGVTCGEDVQVSGWARALALLSDGDGWDGWIKLRGETSEIGAWVHLAVTYSSTYHVAFYKNGGLIDEGDLDSTKKILTSLTKDLIIGGITTNDIWAVDELVVYNRALSSSEIADRYSEGELTTPGGDVAGLWHFNENSGTQVFDSSGDGNDGTVNDNEGDQWVAGKYGSAIQFDGVDDNIIVPATGISSLDNITTEAGGNGITIEAWVKVSVLDDDKIRNIVDKCANGQGGYCWVFERPDPATTLPCYTQQFGGDDWSVWSCGTGPGPGGPSYGVSIDSAPDPSEFEGWAWGSDVVGWVSFNDKDLDGAPGPFDYQVMTDLNFNAPPEASSLLISAGSPAYCGIGTGFGLGYVGFEWIYSDCEGNDQSQYRLQVATDDNFINLVVDSINSQSVSPGGQGSSAVLIVENPSTYSRCIGGGDYEGRCVSYNDSYYWQVSVQDTEGNWSNFVFYGAPDSFTTDLHPWPWPEFTFSPQKISVYQVVHFTDDSTCWDGPCQNNAINHYEWDFNGDGMDLDDCDSDTDSNCRGDVTHTYDTVGDYTVRLYITDDLGTCDTTDNTPIKVRLPLPGWKEILPPIIWLKKTLATIFEFFINI